MDALLEQARQVYEGTIDFEGQRLVELLSTVLLSVSGLLAFLVGYLTQNIHNTLWIGLGGTALTFVVCVPQWPFYNKHPVRWLPRQTPAPGTGASAAGYTGASGLEGIDITVDGKKVQ